MITNILEHAALFVLLHSGQPRMSKSMQSCHDINLLKSVLTASGSPWRDTSAALSAYWQMSLLTRLLWITRRAA